MTDPFVAEIRMFGCNFAPTGWAQCNGQIMPLSQNTALFALLGTMYGGDGKSTFALPNLQGSAPLHWGQGQGLSLYDGPGQQGGAQFVTLLESEIPVHTHSVNASALAANVSTPSPATTLARSTGGQGYKLPGSLTTLDPRALAPAGGSLPHNNLMPYQVVNFCIALQGIFPQRP